MKYELGKTLVIANPTARSGEGAEAAAVVEGTLDYYADEQNPFELLLTRKAGDAWQMAEKAEGFETVIAVGGDGIIHEIVNGLMRIPQARRPRLSVVPVGSGNDFARTIGMKLNDPAVALDQIATGEDASIDLGVVDGNEYFCQTLSFGLDAAIALDTTTRRADNSKQKGALLFASSGLKIMAQAKEGWPYRATWLDADGKSHEHKGLAVVFAVQNGPTYGGGFRITPTAQPDDGALDLCRSIDLPAIPITLATFLAARFGKHTRSKHLAFSQFSHIELEFETEPPSQIDGEPLHGTHHVVDVVPSSLRIIRPRK